MDAEMVAALGARVVGSLEGRGLIHRVESGTVGQAEPSVSADRLAGVVLGLAAGNAVGRLARHLGAGSGVVDRLRQERLEGQSGQVTAETQTFVTSCEAWLDHGWRAPEALAELFARRLSGFRSPGRALVTAVERRWRGVAWHEAATRSYGNGALCRAAAVGIVRAGDARSIGEAGSVDAAVTHASRRATASSAALAGIIAALVRRDGAMAPAALADSIVGSLGHDDVRVSLELVVASRGFTADEVIELTGDWPHATSTLALALWCALEFADPAQAIAVAAACSAHGDTVAAVTGALVGAIHGVSALRRDGSTGSRGRAPTGCSPTGWPGRAPDSHVSIRRPGRRSGSCSTGPARCRRSPTTWSTGSTASSPSSAPPVATRR